MKQVTLLSLVSATLLFTACGEDTKALEKAVKAKAERTIELDKMAANKVVAEAAEKAEVAQIRAAQKAAAKVKAEKEAAEKAKAEQEAAEAAKREAEAKAIAEQALKETNATEEPITDASIIEAVNKETKVTP